MSQSFNQWLDGVKEHYGDLMHFPDATTIRNMRKGQLNILAEHERISKGIENDGARADYHQTFADESPRPRPTSSSRTSGWREEG